MRSIDFIGANFGLGGCISGSELSPQQLRSLGIFQRMAKFGVSIIDRGNVSQSQNTSNHYISQGVYNLLEVVDFCTKLKDVVAHSYSKNHLALVVGGDHSIALGSLSATLDYDPNAIVIWVDAHTDINTEESSPSHNAHGMPMAAILHLCKSKLTTLVSTPIKSDHIFYLGVRDIDEGEQNILQRYHIHTYTMHDIRQRGISTILQQISDQLRQMSVKTVHVSFDIDSMNPSIASATGTPVTDGFTEKDFSIFCQWLPLKIIRVIDFVEYNPLLDNNNETANWCCSAIEKMLVK